MIYALNVKISRTCKGIIDKLLFGNAKKKQTSEYWWSLRTSAMLPGLQGYIRKQQYHKLERLFNAFIPLSVSFAEKPILPHGINGIFISAGAKIGVSCTIFHQVTIGSNTLADSKGYGSPTIGNHVYIGCGAKIIGNVTIGDHVRIGANCVITHDIPSNCTVVAESPRLILKENMDNSFVTYQDAFNK